jgi:2,5-diamino-6-(ribosylamino)-4(3H)-pyrimidinone 5'-phosphate reductase
MRTTDRPYVICHMLPSIDGRIVLRDWKVNMSILVGPVADGSTGTPSLFDVEDRGMPARSLKLLSMEKRAGGIVWLRYKVRR